MKQGERIQYSCGHWLVAGEFGIQDNSVKNVPIRRCGECQRRLQDAAPELLAMLGRGIALVKSINTVEGNDADTSFGLNWLKEAEATYNSAAKSAVGDRDPVE